MAGFDPKNLVWRVPLYASSSCVALIIVAGAEALLVLGKDSSAGADQLGGLFSSTLELTFTSLLLPFAIVTAGLIWKACQRELSFQRSHLVVDATFGVGIGVATYVAFANYEPFRTYPPLIAACLGLAAVLSLSMMVATDEVRLPIGKYKEGMLWVMSAGCLLGAAGLYWANYAYHPGLYYDLHLGVMYATLALVSLGMFGLAGGWRLSDDTPPRRAGVAIAAVVVGAGAIAALPSSEAEPHTRNYSIVGQSQVLFEDSPSTDEPPDVPEESPVERSERVSYAEVFEGHHSFPDLPEDFDLDDYNVLWVTIEAVRFDQTTLGNPKLDTTLNLMRFGDQAYVNTRAYSPSSGTLHSMASNLAMAYPSMLPLETWKKAWHGELHQSATTIAELFRQDGRSTFWIGHNHNKGFDAKINGFKQGFDDVELTVDRSGRPRKTLDRDIARDAVEKLEALSASASREKEERFFGLVFFASPHGPYLTHYPEWRQESQRDKYRHEIAYADEQFQAVLDALRETGLWDNTIVVFMSDHGEEFGEHGGTRHKSTVYSEVTHVPFVMRIPGVPASKSDVPMSTAYVWPWLLSHADGELADYADAQIDASIGPIIEHTGGGVLTELIGHDRMKSALVYPRMKINYDFSSEFYELYDLQKDPLEQKNLFRSSHRAQEFEQHMRRYRAFRSENERHTLAVDKK